MRNKRSLLCISLIALLVFSWAVVPASASEDESNDATQSIKANSDQPTLSEEEKEDPNPQLVTVRFVIEETGEEYSTQTVKEGDTVTKPKDPKVTQAEFAGWYTADNPMAPFDFSTPITQDMVLYGRIIHNSGPIPPSRVFVSIVPNNGKQAYSELVSNGSKVSSISKPVREGYEFVGWYTEDGKPIPMGTVIFSNSAYYDTTLYAHWKKTEDSTVATITPVSTKTSTDNPPTSDAGLATTAGMMLLSVGAASVVFRKKRQE